MFVVIARPFKDLDKNQDFLVRLGSFILGISDQVPELGFPEVSDEKQWRVSTSAELIPIMEGLKFLIESAHADVDQSLITAGQGDILEIILQVVREGGKVADLVIILTEQQTIMRHPDVELREGSVLVINLDEKDHENDKSALVFLED
jgi:hypothetical protein